MYQCKYNFPHNNEVKKVRMTQQTPENKDRDAQLQELMQQRTKLLDAIRAARGYNLYDLEAELEDLDADIRDLEDNNQ